MKRLFIAALSVIALVSSCGTGASDKEIGLQLYSIREVIGSPEKYDANHAEAFARLASWGYKTIEMYGYKDGTFFGHTPDEIKADFDAAGLRIISTHTMRNLTPEQLESADFTEPLEWWKQTIEDHKVLGCEYIVAPSFKVPDTLDGLKTYCEYFNAIGRLCAENGIKFGYHNHRHEFRTIEDRVIYDYMLENTDPRYVFFEMDLYWAVKGGAAPVKYFNRYPGRFLMFHFKDDAELGQTGSVGFYDIFQNADKAGLQHYFVEIEHSDLGEIMESCRVSAEYVKSCDYVKAQY